MTFCFVFHLHCVQDAKWWLGMRSILDQKLVASYEKFQNSTIEKYNNYTFIWARKEPLYF